MASTSAIFLTSFLLTTVHFASSQSFNPTILQDSRDLPKTDGRFGFLYRTEDGISHAAKSEGDGIVHGRYTYSDPTGFKLNFNYNAGTKVTPGYNYDQQPQRQPAAAPIYEENEYSASGPSTYDNNYADAQPQPQQIRRTRPQTSNRNDLRG